MVAQLSTHDLKENSWIHIFPMGMSAMIMGRLEIKSNIIIRYYIERERERERKRKNNNVIQLVIK